MTEQIPLEVLQAARLRMKRRVAAMLVSALAETGCSYHEMDAKLGHAPGWSRQYINALIDGTTTDLDIVADLCTAMDVEFVFTACPIPASKAQNGAEQ